MDAPTLASHCEKGVRLSANSVKCWRSEEGKYSAKRVVEEDNVAISVERPRQRDTLLLTCDRQMEVTPNYEPRQRKGQT